MQMVDLQKTLNICFVPNTCDLKQIQSDNNLAIWLSRGRTLGGETITAGLLCNPIALQQLV